MSGEKLEINNKQAEEAAIIQKINEQRRSLYKKDVRKVNKLEGDFLDKLREKYPNYTDFRTYHVLSGTPLGECLEFDFPGDDSIEQFFNQTYENFDKQ